MCQSVHGAVYLNGTGPGQRLYYSGLAVCLVFWVGAGGVGGGLFGEISAVRACKLLLVPNTDFHVSAGKIPPSNRRPPDI